MEKRLRPQPAWRTTKGGFPLIAGTWEESTNKVIVTQREGSFSATCEYKHATFGEIRWRCEGTISKDGKLSCTLTHTKAPASFVKTQSRTAQLSPNGETLVGRASWDGGLHDFTWTLARPAK